MQRIRGKCAVCGHPKAWLDKKHRCPNCRWAWQRNNACLIILIILWLIMVIRECQ